MNILKYLRTKLEGLIKGKQNKRLISGKVESKGGITEERRSKERDFRTRTYHDPVYSRNSIFYTILKKHYNLSEDFAKNVIVQGALKSAIERKISNKSRWIDINSLSMNKILEILEGEVTVSPDNITIRNTTFDEISVQTYFINIAKNRKGIKIIEEEAETYKTFTSMNKKHREYNKYNVLMTRSDETKVIDKYENARNTHNRTTIMRNESSPFVVSYEYENISEGRKSNGIAYYSEVYPCIELEEPSIYIDGYPLEKGEDNAPDFCRDRLISDMEKMGTSDAINFLTFGKNEYPAMFDTLTK